MDNLHSFGFVFDWLYRSTVQATLLVCLILIIKLIVRDRLSPKWHAFLWLLLLFRMIVPWGIDSKFGVVSSFAGQIRQKLATSVLADLRTEPQDKPAPSDILKDSSTKVVTAPKTKTVEKKTGAFPKTGPIIPTVDLGRGKDNIQLDNWTDKLDKQWDHSRCSCCGNNQAGFLVNS